MRDPKSDVQPWADKQITHRAGDFDLNLVDHTEYRDGLKGSSQVELISVRGEKIAFSCLK